MNLNFITINLKKHLKKQIKIFFLILITAVVLTGCGKESHKKEYLARVNDTYFTKDDLNAVIDSGSGRNFYKNEIIRDWINKELLYQEAKNSGILDDKVFLNLRNQSEKELAVTFLVNKIFNEVKLQIDPEEIKDYYEKNRDDFKLFQNAYFINLIQLKDEDKAIDFRDNAFENGWGNAENKFKYDTSVVNKINSHLVYEFEIEPARLVQVVRELLPGEISIVISDSTGNYYLLQLLKKFEKGSVPPYEIVSNLVRDRYIALKKEQFMTNYIKELYSKNEIEVR